MLQGEEPVVGQDGGVRMAENGEDAAFMHRIKRQRRRKKLFLNHRGGKDTHSVLLCISPIFPKPWRKLGIPHKLNVRIR